MNLQQSIFLTESPRDAQQGLPYTILPEKRAAYINALLKVGFDVIDFGSFVSPKAIPQMANQVNVLERVNKTGSKTRLMAIVGNMRGGTEASAQSKLDIIGFPYSTSETFLLKNINSNEEKALKTIDGLNNLCKDSGKELRIFLSMAFGNPYGDLHTISLLADKIGSLIDTGICSITLADTIGVATPESISETFRFLSIRFPETKFGLHIHTLPGEWQAKINAAWHAGCRSFDGVINGIGGCPMTGYELVGNLNTSNLLAFCDQNKIQNSIDENAYQMAILAANIVFEHSV